MIRRVAGNWRRWSSTIERLAGSEEQRDGVRIEGWAKSVQKIGQMVFVKVGDGRSGEVVQVVADRMIAKQVRVGSAMMVKGSWKRSAGSKQAMELAAEEVNVVAQDEKPRYDLSEDQLRKEAHLRARSTEFAAVLRARSRLFHKTHEFYTTRDFVHIDTPKMTRNDCEGGGEVYRVDGAQNADETYLTVSSQLHLEAMVSRLAKVYTLGPAFRAEKQQSHTHLSEFYMLEAEVAFTNLDSLCSLVEDYIKSMLRFVNEDEAMQRTLNDMGMYRKPDGTKIPLDAQWPRMSYDEAVKTLENAGDKVIAKSGLSKSNELKLVQLVGSPVFVTHFPAHQKPFYMSRNDKQQTLSFDLLSPVVGEIAGGSMREQKEDELRSRGCNIEWYLNSRKRGQPPTGGFGIGFERMLQLLLAIRNIKDTIAFPRWHKHCQC